MHASSLENMQKCYERFLGSSCLLQRAKIRVLDIGSTDVNGSYREIFSDSKFDYIGVDLTAGPGVDIVLTDPYELPFADAGIDIVLCGQVFEHAEFFWKLFEEMARVLGEHGLLFLIAPSTGPIHRYPVDCYRFHPDAFEALAKYAALELLDCWMDDRGPWRDVVGIYQRPGSRAANRVISEREALPKNRFTSAIDASFLSFEGTGAEDERMAGDLPYLELLEELHQTLKPRTYLEIGVRAGQSFALADCASLCIDPYPRITAQTFQDARLFACSSDEFFDFHSDILVEMGTIDLGFIDGMHLFEFALRDFMNIERYSSKTGVIAIDDVLPNTRMQAERVRQSRVWTGDVWKLYYCLSEHRADLELLLLDTYPTGMLVIGNLNPGDTILREHYNLLVRKFQEISIDGVAEELFVREHAISATDPRVADFLLRHRCQ